MATSTDWGMTWTQRANIPGYPIVASSADGTKLVAGTENGAIYTSTGPLP
jgi:hypothetical protein